MDDEFDWNKDVVIASKMVAVENIEKLPKEMMIELFSYLDLRTLFKSCRLVSKRWMTLVDHYARLKEMVISCYEDSEPWFYTEEPIDENSVLPVDFFQPIYRFEFFKRAVKQPIFKRIEKLKIKCLTFVLGTDQQEIHANFFRFLSHLPVFKLPRLETLKIDRYNCWFSNLCNSKPTRVLLRQRDELKSSLQVYFEDELMSRARVYPKHEEDGLRLAGEIFDEDF